MNFRTLLFSAVSLLFGTLAASAQFRVTAIVNDPEGSPEEYATFRIYAHPDTVHPIVGNVTTIDGQIDAGLPGKGNYTLLVTSVMKAPLSVDFSVDSLNPIADLGIISTQYDGQTLDEVTVIAQKPLVTKEIDRIGYDVTADAEASTSSLREILRKVPLVSVDDDGSIKVNGSSDFKIYRNGRPNNAFTKNAKDIFAAIPASTIKKIEVITDPGAREDAESSGVILNIVTTSTVSMSGVTGNVGLNWISNQGPQANAFLMTQLDKLTLSGSGGAFSYSKNLTHGTLDSHLEYQSTGDIQEENYDFQAGGRGGWFNVEGSLEIDSLNLITTALDGFIIRNYHDMQGKVTMFDNTGDVDYAFNQNSYYRKNGYTDIDFSLDYQHLTHLPGETLTLSYRLSHTRQDQDQTTDYIFLQSQPFPYTSNLSDFDLKFFEHTFQFDWGRPFGQHYKLDTGAKYIYRTSHSVNHQNLVDFNQTFNEFEHRYNIFALYADARASFGKITGRVGLRYEYSRLNADFLTDDQDNFHANLNDFVPNASLSWNASESSMWKLSFNRRIQRPGISYLNPAVRITPASISFGNPDLQSAVLNNLLINYSFIKAKFNLDLTASYNFTNNGIGALQWTDQNILYSTYDNLMHSRALNFSIFSQWMISPKTSFMINAEINWNRYSLTNEMQHIHLAKFNTFFYARLQQQLPLGLTLTLSSNYFSGLCSNPYGYVTTPASNIGYSVGLKRSFLKNKTLDINLTASNIGLPDIKQTYYFINNGISGYQITKQARRQAVAIGISWRFGNLRAQVKKTAATITNDDLEGRKN